MDSKISQFSLLSSPTAFTIIPVVQSGNNYVIAVSALFNTNFNLLNSGTVVLSGASVTLGRSGGTVNLTTSYGTREVSSTPAVSVLSAINSQAVLSLPYYDETHVILPSSSLSALSWTLPKATVSRVGQIKTFYTSQNITTLTVSVSGGGSFIGTSLTTALANEAYSYQCIGVAGNGIWLRLA